jgi:type IV secretion system protein VirB8
MKHIEQKIGPHTKKVFLWMQSKLGKVHLRVIRKIKGKKMKRVIPSDKPSEIDALTTLAGKNYFVTARSWADDIYTQTIISRNRYKIAFFVAMGLALLLTIAIDGLIPMQHLVPLLVNHYPDGRVSVQPIQQPYAPSNQAAVESDLVRYVLNRESYDPTSYDTQYSLINLMSDALVAKQYIRTQSSDNKAAPIHLLGNKGWRSVHIDSVVFLDSKIFNKDQPTSRRVHHNLAQINLTTTNHFKNASVEKSKAFTALVSWDYRGTPRDPMNRWRDWNGFTVTRYTLSQRNVEKSRGSDA